MRKTAVFVSPIFSRSKDVVDNISVKAGDDLKTLTSWSNDDLIHDLVFSAVKSIYPARF